MKKSLFSFAVLLLLSHFSFAQKIELQNAYSYWKNGELESALKSINLCTSNEATKGLAKTWMYRGNIMLSIAEDPKESGLVFEPLDESYKSYMKARELDTKKEYKYDLQIFMQALAKAYYNMGATSYNKLQYYPAYKNFNRVYELTNMLNNDYKMDVSTDTLNYLRGYCALKTEKYEDAKNIYSSLIDGNKYKSPELYSNLSTAYLELKDTTAALGTITKGREIYPEDNALLIHELNIYLFTHQIDKAVNNLKEAISKTPDNAQLYNALAGTYDNLNDTANAIKNYKKAIELKPDYFESYFGIGRIYFNSAVEVNNQMNKLDLKEQKKYDELSKVRDGLFQQAIPYLEKAKSINPKDMDTLNALKELYTRTNQLDKAAQIKKEMDGGK